MKEKRPDSELKSMLGRRVGGRGVVVRRGGLPVGQAGQAVQGQLSGGGRRKGP